MGASGGISLQGYNDINEVVAVAASGWILKLQARAHWKHGYAFLEPGALTLVRDWIYVVVPFSAVILVSILVSHNSALPMDRRPKAQKPRPNVTIRISGNVTRYMPFSR